MPSRVAHRLRDRLDAGQAPGAGHAAGQIAFLRRNHVDAARAQHLDIFLRRRVLPHVDVHRGSHDHRRGGRQIQRGQKIVGNAARHLRHHIGRGRRHHQHVDPLRHGDVFDRAFHVGGRGLVAEHFGDDFLSGERGKRQRRDEFLRAPGHHHLHFDAFLLEPAHQFGGLVGRHASGNAQCHSHGRLRRATPCAAFLPCPRSRPG